jgi:DNA replication protein DnaC
MAPTLPILLGARVLQGVVAGPLIPLSQAILLGSYPKQKSATALSLWAMTATVGPIAGPLLGGWITDSCSWSWIFYINIPVGIFAAGVTWTIYRNRETQTRKLPIDVVGLGLLIAWVASLQVMLDKGKDLDWFSSPVIVGLAITAMISFAFFLIWELTEENPIVDLRLFGQRNFPGGTIAISIAYAVFFWKSCAVAAVDAGIPELPLCRCRARHRTARHFRGDSRAGDGPHHGMPGRANHRKPGIRRVRARLFHAFSVPDRHRHMASRAADAVARYPDGTVLRAADGHHSIGPPAYDAGRLALMLNELRLPTIARLWPEFAQRSDKEGWQATRLLGALLEHELAERAKRRIERHRAESHLDPTKTLATFDFSMVPMVSKAHVMALATGDAWLEKGATALLFGPPGAGKSHLGSAIGHALIDAGYRVMFTRTSELVQKLQAARQSLQLPSALAKLDRFDLIILDDLSYARKDQAETSVLFELIAERYERRSLLITANQPFSGWNDVFPDPGMTVAAIDRLVHHSTIFEMNVESYRRRTASDKQNSRRRQSSSDNQKEGATNMGE